MCECMRLLFVTVLSFKPIDTRTHFVRLHARLCDYKYAICLLYAQDLNFSSHLSSFCCAFLDFSTISLLYCRYVLIAHRKCTCKYTPRLRISIASRSAPSASFTIRWNHHFFNSSFFLVVALSYSLHTYYFSVAPLFVLFIFLIVPYSPLCTLRTRLFACKLSFLVVPSKKCEIIIKCNGLGWLTDSHTCNTSAMQCEPC